ncbi:hypothetical protein SLS58_000892 [Diplodia intermedia]|uniref:N-acetyltransferase domain-containing protein n=1 Tax=Diplodia intermedia TaxID=856260 RepID=A0ABR3U476_9PEZI
MPLSLLHRRRRLGQAPVPLRTPNNFARATFASNPVADHVIVPEIDDENDSLSASSSSSTDVATSPTVSWLTVYQPSNLSDADTLDNSSSLQQMSSSSSSDLEAMASIDLFPTDMWSIAQRAATLGQRRYIALPTTTANNTITARASHVHALVTQQILPQNHHSGSTPRILIVWATASRAARSRGIMRALFTGALLAGTHPDILHPADAWGRPGETVPDARPVLSCSPAALLRCEEEILPLNPTIVFAEMPIPELDDDDDDNSDDDDDDAKGGSRKLRENKNKIRINSRKRQENEAAAAAAELWRAVAGFAGSAGDERSRVYTFLDPGAAADRRVARRLRSMMRLEGVEVPPLVARMAEAGIADPVDGGDKDGGGDGVEGDGDADEGGVSLGRC